MDGQRFDLMAKAMAGGATRRRALRLAGGGLAGALLAAGLGRRAGAQQESCGDLHARCLERAGGACGTPETAETAFAHYTCLSQQGGVCNAYFESCAHSCGSFDTSGRACASGCPGDTTCIVTTTPGNVVLCRCVEL